MGATPMTGSSAHDHVVPHVPFFLFSRCRLDVLIEAEKFVGFYFSYGRQAFVFWVAIRGLDLSASTSAS